MRITETKQSKNSLLLFARLSYNIFEEFSIPPPHFSPRLLKPTISLYASNCVSRRILTNMRKGRKNYEILMLLFYEYVLTEPVLYVDFRFHIIQAYSKPRRKIYLFPYYSMFRRFCWIVEKCCALCALFSIFTWLFLLSASAYLSPPPFPLNLPPFHWASAIFIMKKAQEKFPFPLSTRCYCRMVYIFYFHIFMLTYSLRSFSPPLTRCSILCAKC